MPAPLLLSESGKTKISPFGRHMEKTESICMLCSFPSFSKKIAWVGHILSPTLRHAHFLSTALQAGQYHSKLSPLLPCFQWSPGSQIMQVLSVLQMKHIKTSSSHSPPRNQGIIHCSTLLFPPKEEDRSNSSLLLAANCCVRLGVGWTRLERKDSCPCFSLSVLGFSHTWDTASSYMMYRVLIKIFWST